MIGVTKDLVTIEEWSVDEIKKRNNWIGDCFIKIWNISPRENELVNYSEFRKD